MGHPPITEGSTVCTRDGKSMTLSNDRKHKKSKNLNINDNDNNSTYGSKKKDKRYETII